MTRAWMVALVAVAACKQRGTITVPFVEACSSTPDERIAVYLVRDLDCATLSCGFAFDCAPPGCVALCATNGYCTPDEVKHLTIDPASAGDYALVFTYQYQSADAGVGFDDGLECFPIHVDADGTRSAELPSPVDAGTGSGGNPCCMATH